MQRQRRPLSITIISWFFIVFGLVTFIYGFLAHNQPASTGANESHFFDTWLVPLIRALATVCGLFLLFGHNWARWLLAAWMASHIMISLIVHSIGAFLTHCIIFGVIGWFLFRPQAGQFFRAIKDNPT